MIRVPRDEVILPILLDVEDLESPIELPLCLYTMVGA